MNAPKVRIRGRPIGEIVEKAHEVLREIWPLLPADRQIFGGYMCLLDEMTRQVLFVIKIGIEDNMSLETAARSLDLSLNNARSLLEHVGAPSRHKSSWQSRFLTLDQYGGAISTNGIILSFCSGFSVSELGDEAMMLHLAVQLGWLMLSEAERIADISNNHYFRKLIGTGKKVLPI